MENKEYHFSDLYTLVVGGESINKLFLSEKEAKEYNEKNYFGVYTIQTLEDYIQDYGQSRYEDGRCIYIMD